MFKLSIYKVDVSVYILESPFNLWHARLSHVNYGSIRYMSRLLAIMCSWVPLSILKYMYNLL